MTLLYGPESAKVITDHLNLPYRKHVVPRLIENLQANSHITVASRRPGDDRHLLEIHHWFSALPPQERELAVCLHSPLLVSLLFQMHLKRLMEGEIEAALINQAKPEGTATLRDFFRFRKTNKFAGDYEHFIRLTDTEGYLDTLTVDPKILSHPDKFFDFMKEVSNNQAFTVPCRECKHGEKVFFEYPAWIAAPASPFRSILEWACAGIEQALWMNYWGKNRLRGSSGSAIVKAKVLSFWDNLPICKRLGFLDKVREGVDEIQLKLKSEESYQITKCKVSKAFVSQFFSGQSPKSSLVYSKKLATVYQSEESLDFFAHKIIDSADFVNLLVYSSFLRGFTLFDVAARQMFSKLLKAAEIVAFEALQVERPRVPVRLNKKPRTAPTPHRRGEVFRRQVFSSTMVEFNFEDALINDKSTVFVSGRSSEITPVKRNSSKNLSVIHSANAIGKFVPLAEDFPPLQALSPLHNEIKQFHDQIAQRRPEKLEIISNIIKDLHRIVNRPYPDSEIVMFGSYASKLALESSDVDLQILNLKFNNRYIIQRVCIDLGNLLQSFSYVSNVKKLPQAYTPVVRFNINLNEFDQSKQGVINVDISFGNKTGPNFGRQSLQVTCEYLEQFPCLSYMMVVLKTFMHSINLNNAYHGGMNSYSLLLWIVAFLKHCKMEYQDYGQLLIDILGFYGNKFDLKKQAIDPKTEHGFTHKNIANGHAATIDPINPANDTTRTGYRILSVLEAFQTAHNYLTHSDHIDFKQFLNVN